MIDFYSVEEGVSFVSAFFVGHNDILIIVEIRSEYKSKSDNSADGHMSVVVSLSIHLKKLGIYRPLKHKSRSSDSIADCFVKIIFFAEGGGIKRDIELFYKFYTDQTILPATDSD